ncbi:hypothetical protein BZA05DRAFT_398785 [Tricharina praecox]|uniref:uncharacterized protein n=1 Tax=Tricharina praecox TaxID=43433 RepID=UPI00221F694E|nr:uncharacterized protein BZA05DRAFT_398785 [Tricharina praecox]KAI5850821.1 hypothetical protein BZA05DRAFT_398785 [Tricharina praecox]
MGKTSKSKRTRNPPPNNPPAHILASSDPQTPLSGSSSDTSPGEISPVRATPDAHSFEESLERRLSEEKEKEAVRDNLAECLTESEARNDGDQGGERNKDKKGKGRDSPTRVRYLSGKNKEVLQRQRTDKGKVEPKAKQEGGQKVDKSPVTVRYTFGGKEMESATAKSKIEAGRLAGTQEEKDANLSPTSRSEDHSYAAAAATDTPHEDESGLGGSYENVSMSPSTVPKTPNNTKAGPGSGGQNTPAVPELDKIQLRPDEMGENIGDRLHQELKHESERMGNSMEPSRHQGDMHADAEHAATKARASHGGKGSSNAEHVKKPEVADKDHPSDGKHHRKDAAPDAETRELQHSHIKPGDFGTNIGDAVHQRSAHEELEHKKLQHVLSTRPIAIPQQPPVEFTSGPATPRHRPSITEPSKRPGDGVDEGHKGKIPRRSSIELGIEPEVPVPPLAQEKLLPASTPVAEQSPTDYIGRFPPTSQFLEGTNRRPQTRPGSRPETPRPETPLLQLPGLSRSQLNSILAPRDTAIWELQNEVSTLKMAVVNLQAERPRDGGRDVVRRREGVERFTKYDRVQDGEKSEMELVMDWALWGGLVVGVATVAGWVGAAVERGAVGRSVAEWVWRQAGRGVYAG